ncbi:MAG: tripartite tricarboxylate transporter TctB family protein [Defluviimonas sp.]|nr:tripartite tricarboxylate transporter TctB family protein [Defluviimonas sp.]
MQANLKDLGAGAIFILAGSVYGSMAWFGLPIGQALNMGPGYFPIVLSAMLIILGLAIAGRGFIDISGREPFGVVPWRGVVMLSLATVVFAALIEKLGMLPGVFLTCFLASLANPKAKLRNSLVSSLSIAIFCTAVFAYGIRLPIPVVGKWLGGW